MTVHTMFGILELPWRKCTALYVCARACWVSDPILHKYNHGIIAWPGSGNWLESHYWSSASSAVNACCLQVSGFLDIYRLLLGSMNWETEPPSKLRFCWQNSAFRLWLEVRAHFWFSTQIFCLSQFIWEHLSDFWKGQQNQLSGIRGS